MASLSPTEHNSSLRLKLDDLLAQISWDRYRERDPVSRVWAYETRDDQEVAALIASTLAYGRVELVLKAIDEALGQLGPFPAKSLVDAPEQVISRQFRHFSYRMTRSEDLIDLMVALGRTLKHYGTLEAAYNAGFGESHRVRASEFVHVLRTRRMRKSLRRGFAYLLPDPSLGSASKRLNLFFRWVSRGPDQVDLGLWKSLDPSKLIMPLDTHTSRICRYLGLTQRKSADLKAALEVTESLRRFDPKDPLKYDFALCHLGISRRCIHQRSEEHCPFCPLDEVCQLA